MRASALMLLLVGGTAGAGTAGAEAPERPVEEITVRGERPVNEASRIESSPEDWELRPIESPSQLLEVVPGLITSQHAGGGKSDQYLIRGFDADHGTDLAIFFDGIPVNMRSHAHGQGFADVHFVIPETIARIEVAKGPYEARVGDFGTAATVEFVPFERVDESLVRGEFGEWSSYRSVAVGSPRFGIFEGEDAPARALVAFEAVTSDGPFVNEEDLWGYKGLVRGSLDVGENGTLEALGSYYGSDWDASGQVPARAIRSGLIPRFGSIDPSEGGQTSRGNALLRYRWEPGPDRSLAVTGWASRYELELFSNFTFQLSNDPPASDGIVQRDDRWLWGGRAEYRQLFAPAEIPVVVAVGVDTRTDHAQVFLGTQTARTVTGATSDAEVKETSVAGYARAEIAPVPWARSVLGLRGEQFFFDVSDVVPGQPSGDESDGVVLPKANLFLAPFSEAGPLPSDVGPIRDLELFLNFGRGFHSNDARSVVSGQAGQALPLATGAEGGFRSRLLERLSVSLTGWWLDLESELVYVGDEGTTEPSGSTRRYGVELFGDLAITEWLHWLGDVTFSRAEFRSGGAVPQAPRFVATSELRARHESGLSAELRLRVLGSRYGTEDRSVLLDAYQLLDLGLRYRRGPFELKFFVENLLDQDWRSSEFYFESCLASELGVAPGCPLPNPTPGQARGAGVPDSHFTPGNPRNFRGSVTVWF